MHFTTGFFALSFVLATATLAQASLNLSHIQALVGFPQACTDAYNTPINDCNDAHYNSGPLCSCSSACSSALDAITNTITNACQGTGASPNTLIGLFFEHAATEFLCNPPADGGGGCGPGAGASSSQQGASSQASSTTVSTSQTMSGMSTTQNLSSQSMKSTISMSPLTSSSTLASPSSSSPLSTSSSTKSSASSKSSATSRSSSSQAKPTTGGGSPFDISSNTGTKIDLHLQTLALLLLYSTAIGLVFL